MDVFIKDFWEFAITFYTAGNNTFLVEKKAPVLGFYIFTLPLAFLLLGIIFFAQISKTGKYENFYLSDVLFSTIFVVMIFH